MDLDRLLADLRVGSPVSLARAISLVENGRQGFEQLLSALHPRVGRAYRVGITGPPGSGKSTLAQQLASYFRGQGLTVAIVAVDPTSPFTGGALLGDRIRMEAVAMDQGVFIRSMATRGSLGGLATSTREVCDVLDAAGFDRILIETVGVGQSELDVARMADSTVLVLVPESGDDIQAMKSGIMEIADLFVVNKGDRPGAEKLQHEIQVTLGIRQGNAFRGIRAHHAAPLGTDRRADGQTDSRPSDARSVLSSGGAGTAPGGTVRPSGPAGKGAGAQWDPPVLLATASKGEGIGPIAEGLGRHYAWTGESGRLAQRRRERFAARTREVVERAMRRWIWDGTPAEEAIRGRLTEIEAGRTSPYEVAAEIVAVLKEGIRV